jgi:hypothetical protein
MTLKGPKRFLLAFAATVIGGFAAVVAVNAVVDPFWRFDLITIHGINGQRPVFSSYARLSKAGVVCRLRPRQIVFGTSRVEVGLDPKHPGWSEESGPVYNMGLSGIGLKELLLNFRHAVNTSPLSRAVIGLDFLMFNANREATVFGTEVIDFDINQLVLDREDSCWRKLYYNAGRFFGTQGLFYSYFTVKGQLTEADRTDKSKANAWASLYDRDGFRSYFHIGFDLLLGANGTRWAFSEGQEHYYVIKVWRPPPGNRYCFAKPGQPSTMDTFRELVRTARQSGVDVRFYLEPLHARMMLAIQDAGLWPQFEDWKRGIVDVLSEEAKASGKPQFPIWDFSGFNSVTDEHVPGPEDKTTRMRWFWEDSHYNKEAGDMILDRVLDYQAPGRTIPQDFGIRLRPENIEDWLVATRKAGRDYVGAEPGEARMVQETVASALAGSAGSNCGYYMDELRAASAALQRGDTATANAAIARAIAIDAADRQRAADMGVTYWEPGFATALQSVQEGAKPPPDPGG